MVAASTSQRKLYRGKVEISLSCEHWGTGRYAEKTPKMTLERCRDGLRWSARRAGSNSNGTTGPDGEDGVGRRFVPAYGATTARFLQKQGK